MLKFILWVLVIVIVFNAGRAMASEMNEVVEVNGIGAFLLGSLLVQSLFLMFKTHFTEALGIYRLVALGALSLIATIVLNVMLGKTLEKSLLSDSGTLLAYQVLLHQMKKQWNKQESE